MVKDGEGGVSYQIFEFVGLYVRYFISKLLRMDISLTELSGKKDYPHIDKRIGDPQLQSKIATLTAKTAPALDKVTIHDFGIKHKI